MSKLDKKPDAAAKKEFARESALPARVELKNAWCQMVTLCLETADTWGAIDHVFTHEMFNRGEMGLIEGHDRALGAALGGELPDALRPDHTYYGAPRLIVPTQRSVTFKGEALTLKTSPSTKRRQEMSPFKFVRSAAANGKRSRPRSWPAPSGTPRFPPPPMTSNTGLSRSRQQVPT